MLDVSEHRAIDFVQVRPAWGKGRRARQWIEAAIELSGQAAPVITAVIILLQDGPEAHRRVLAQVGFADGVEELVLFVGTVYETIAGIVQKYGSAPQCALFVQRSAHVDLAVVVVPRASADFGFELVGVRWAFTHQVDGR
ncbi:hypothetical protein D3C76_1170190 [compost metagenome]